KGAPGDALGELVAAAAAVLGVGAGVVVVLVLLLWCGGAAAAHLGDHGDAAAPAGEAPARGHGAQLGEGDVPAGRLAEALGQEPVCEGRRVLAGVVHRCGGGGGLSVVAHGRVGNLIRDVNVVIVIL